MSVESRYRRVVIAALLGIASGGWACGMPASSTSAFTVFRGATLIDGTGAFAIPDAVVVIKDDAIVAAGPRDRVEIPPTAQSIDVTGKWLMPAMSDAHMHFSESGGLYSRPDVYDLRKWRPHEREVEWTRTRLPYTLSRYLCAGITSILALAEPREALVRRYGHSSVSRPRVASISSSSASSTTPHFHFTASFPSSRQRSRCGPSGRRWQPGTDPRCREGRCAARPCVACGLAVSPWGYPA